MGISLWRQIALAVLVGVMPLMPTAQPAVAQHAVVTNVQMTQVISTQRIKFTWDKIATAKKYRIRIMHGSDKIAKKNVDKPHAKFKESKFSDYETYTVYIRAKGNANYTVNAWTEYTFIYFDADHDNDLISDEDDYDDDNDGIPDTIDDDPYSVSGTVYPIIIENNALQSGTISILQNDSVTWINKDEGGHAVAASNGSWYSPPLQRNESYTHVFGSTGIFTYYDPTYPGVANMMGTITVSTE